MPTNPFFMPTGQSNLGNTIGSGVTWTPEQFSDWTMAYANTDAGKAAQRARDKTVNLNRKQVLDGLKAERDRIALQKGKQEADRWYQRESLKLLAEDQAFERDKFAQTHALDRDKFAADTTLRTAQLGASLRGPEDWPAYLRASNFVAGSGLSGLTANQPGGMGQMTPGFTPQRATLGGLLADFGGGGGGMGAGIDAPISNAQLGLSDNEAGTLRGYMMNPNSAPGGWLESKTPDQRGYLRGLMQEWGMSPDTVETNYMNSRPRQGSALMASAGF